MSARWEGEELLLQPITPEQPCGENLEDTELLASFDTFRLFGQSRPLDAPPDPTTRTTSGSRSRRSRPNGPRFATRQLEALGKSKDLRLLAYLGTALLRTDGLPAFAADAERGRAVARDATGPRRYPLVDEDAILRRNALNCFADPMAVVDRLRRLPLVEAGSTARSAFATSTSRPASSPGRDRGRRRPINARVRGDAARRRSRSCRQRGRQAWRR